MKMDFEENKLCYMVREKYQYIIIVVCKRIVERLLFEDYNGFGYYDFFGYRSKVYETVEEALEVLRTNVKKQKDKDIRRKRMTKLSVNFKE